MHTKEAAAIADRPRQRINGEGAGFGDEHRLALLDFAQNRQFEVQFLRYGLHHEIKAVGQFSNGAHPFHGLGVADACASLSFPRTIPFSAAVAK